MRLVNEDALEWVEKVLEIFFRVRLWESSKWKRPEMRIYITSLVSLAAANFLLRRGETFYNAYHKRCRMSSPRQKYAFAAATYHAAARYKSRRGRSPAPRREQVVAAAKNLPRAPCSRHILSPRHHTIPAAANVFLAAAGISLRRGEASTTLT